MKAIVQDRYGSTDVLELRDIKNPRIGDNDLLVRIHPAGCGPDVWHVMTGLPYFARFMLGFSEAEDRGPGRGLCRDRRGGRCRRCGHQSG
jgi:NADPH:quinone reductase-like Zn-dependent oxidoreductase